jgi:hypothetical protein
VQLAPTILQDMDTWPGLTRSEALRLSIERGHYLSTLNSEEIAGIADEYAPILRRALEDLSYEDYKIVVRSLPSLVIGILSEVNRSWKSDDGDRQLEPQKLIEKLETLTPVERIEILDCVVSERHHREAKAK